MAIKDLTTEQRNPASMHIDTVSTAEMVKIMNEEDLLITKEYVRGSKNQYINPAVSEYNKTCTAANGTVQSLLKIISTLSKDGLKGSNNADDDPFK